MEMQVDKEAEWIRDIANMIRVRGCNSLESAASMLCIVPGRALEARKTVKSTISFWY